MYNESQYEEIDPIYDLILRHANKLGLTWNMAYEERLEVEDDPYTTAIHEIISNTTMDKNNPNKSPYTNEHLVIINGSSCTKIYPDDLIHLAKAKLAEKDIIFADTHNILLDSYEDNGIPYFSVDFLREFERKNTGLFLDLAEKSTTVWAIDMINAVYQDGAEKVIRNKAKVLMEHIQMMLQVKTKCPQEDEEISFRLPIGEIGLLLGLLQRYNLHFKHTNLVCGLKELVIEEGKAEIELMYIIANLYKNLENFPNEAQKGVKIMQKALMQHLTYTLGDIPTRVFPVALKSYTSNTGSANELISPKSPHIWKLVQINLN